MYEDAYGFSFIRVMAHSFMIFLIVIFMYTLIKIWIEKLSLFHFYFISALLYYTVMNVIDVAANGLVTANIERYEQTGKIDIHYLNSLSYTGILGLIDLYEENSQLPGLKNILLERKNAANFDRITKKAYNFKRVQANQELSKLQLE